MGEMQMVVLVIIVVAGNDWSLGLYPTYERDLQSEHHGRYKQHKLPGGAERAVKSHFVGTPLDVTGRIRGGCACFIQIRSSPVDRSRRGLEKRARAERFPSPSMHPEPPQSCGLRKARAAHL